MRHQDSSEIEEEKLYTESSYSHTKSRPLAQQKRESSVSYTRSKRNKIFTDDDFDMELARMGGGQSNENKTYSKLKKVKCYDSQEIEDSPTTHAVTSQITTQRTNQQDINMNEQQPSRPVYRQRSYKLVQNIKPSTNLVTQRAPTKHIDVVEPEKRSDHDILFSKF